MLQVAFAGTFASRLEPRVRAHLDMSCAVRLADENMHRIARGEPLLNLIPTTN